MIRSSLVYLYNQVVGNLFEYPNGNTQFSYDPGYSGIALSKSLPIRKEPYVYNGIIPYFDNLIAEGWLARLQAKAIGISESDRFGLLLHFGYDLIGAVEIENVTKDSSKIYSDIGWQENASRASFSGVQPKIPLIHDGKIFRIPKPNEISTHIGKLESSQYPELLEIEYQTTLAHSRLLPSDETVGLEWASLGGIDAKVLAIKRFDRIEGKKRHFEEFTQVAGLLSDQKYNYDYAKLYQIMDLASGGLIERDRLLDRLFVSVLTGNTDFHLKNIGWYTESNELTPAYDLPACDLVLSPKSVFALKFQGKEKRSDQIKGKDLVEVSRAWGIPDEAIAYKVNELEKRLPIALKEIELDKLKEYIEKSWNRTFSTITKYLWKQPKKEEKKRRSLKRN